MISSTTLLGPAHRSLLTRCMTGPDRAAGTDVIHEELVSSTYFGVRSRARLARFMPAARAAIVRRRNRRSLLGFISLAHRVPYAPLFLRLAKRINRNIQRTARLKSCLRIMPRGRQRMGGAGVRDTPRASCVPVGDV
jgi:hypothetical protein